MLIRSEGEEPPLSEQGRAHLANQGYRRSARLRRYSRRPSRAMWHSETMIDRRLFLASSAGMLVAARRRDLLADAIARAGGQTALARIKTLSWTGRATVSAGGRSVEIGVSTTVTPFVAARSGSWLVQDGPAKTRSLIIQGDQGWIERDGSRTPMPAAMLRHEQAQYALYGLMMLITAHDRGASVKRGPISNTLVIRHPHAPITTFGFTADARRAWAVNRISAADGRGEVDQRFDFSGELESAGVRWHGGSELPKTANPILI